MEVFRGFGDPEERRLEATTIIQGVYRQVVATHNVHRAARERNEAITLYRRESEDLADRMEELSAG